MNTSTPCTSYTNTSKFQQQYALSQRSFSLSLCAICDFPHSTSVARTFYIIFGNTISNIKYVYVGCSTYYTQPNVTHMHNAHTYLVSRESTVDIRLHGDVRNKRIYFTVNSARVELAFQLEFLFSLHKIVWISSNQRLSLHLSRCTVPFGFRFW